MEPFETAPRDGSPIYALSGRTSWGQTFRFIDGEFWQFVPLRDREVARMTGTWHRPFFLPLFWRPA